MRVEQKERSSRTRAGKRKKETETLASWSATIQTQNYGSFKRKPEENVRPGPDFEAFLRRQNSKASRRPREKNQQGEARQTRARRKHKENLRSSGEDQIG